MVAPEKIPQQVETLMLRQSAPSGEAYITCSESTQNFHGSLPQKIYITTTLHFNANRLGTKW